MQINSIFKKTLPIQLIFILLMTSMDIFAQNPLSPLKLNSPRDTMRIFMKSMDEYRKGVEKNNEEQQLAIEKATRCLDLHEINPLVREEEGKEAAIFLKEAIDRVYILDLNKVPDTSNYAQAPVLLKWTIPDTEITITRISSGVKEGEYEFSAETVARASDYYRRTKHLPYLGRNTGAAYSLPWMETVFPEWAKQSFWVLHIWQWLGLILTILLSFVLRYIAKFLFYILLKLSYKTATDWDERIIIALARPMSYFMGIAYWYGFLFASGIDGKAFTFFNFVLKIILSMNFIYFVYKLSDLVVAVFRENAIKERNPIDEQLIPLLSKTLRIMFVTLGILIALQNLGINVMGLVAGLGIGGLAIALAAKDTAANLFGSIMIFMDRPFKIGDHIIIDGKEGLVEEIGFRSTRVRTWEDSVVSIPNSTVANSDVENMGLRRWRRNVVILSVTYDTSPEKMESFLEGIKYILQKNPLIPMDTINVAFRDFDSSSLNVLMQFGLSVDALSKYLEGRQNVFIEVMRLAKEIDISFAFPTTTLHMETFPEKTPTRVPKEKTTENFKEVIKEFGVEGKSSKPSGLGIFTAPYRELNK